VEPRVLDSELYAPLPAGLRQRWAVGSRLGVRLPHTPGCLIRVRDTGGDVPAVVLLTDAPHTVESYEELVAALTPRVRLVVLEPPGFGFSWASDPSSLGFPGATAAVLDALHQLQDRRRARRGLRVRLSRPGGGRRGPVAGPRGAARADPFLGRRRCTGDETCSTRAGGWPHPGWRQVGWRQNQRAALDSWYRYAAGPAAPVERWQQTAQDVLDAGGSYALASQSQTWWADGVSPPPPVDLPGAVLLGRGRPITTATPAPAPSRSSSCCPRAGSWPCPPPATSSTRRPSPPPPPRSCYSCCPDLTWRRRQGCRAPTCRSPVDRQLGLGTGPCSESVGLGLPQGCGRYRAA